MKMDADEKQLFKSVERAEWKSAKGGKRERARYSRLREGHVPQGPAAEYIRLSSKDLEAIQKRALAEGLPYQTLISSLLHKYAAGRLKEIRSAVVDLTRLNSLPKPYAQPRARQLPVAHHCLGRNTKGFCCLFDAEPPKKSEFDDLSPARILLRERVQASSRASSLARSVSGAGSYRSP